MVCLELLVPKTRGSSTTDCHTSCSSDVYPREESPNLPGLQSELAWRERRHPWFHSPTKCCLAWYLLLLVSGYLYALLPKESRCTEVLNLPLWMMFFSCRAARPTRALFSMFFRVASESLFWLNWRRFVSKNGYINKSGPGTPSTMVRRWGQEDRDPCKSFW